MFICKDEDRDRLLKLSGRLLDEAVVVSMYPPQHSSTYTVCSDTCAL